MGDSPGPLTGQAQVINDEKVVIDSQKAEGGLNWLLPIFGAIGFGIGFAVIHAITQTMLYNAQNAFAHYGMGSKSGLGVEIIRGLFAGALGGGMLGLAYKNKMNVLYFALSGAIGFGIAFTVVTSLDPGFAPALGRNIMHVMGSRGSLTSFETALSIGLGAGVIVGAIGGLILGLASSYARITSSIFLCIVGIIWFGNAFAFGASLPHEAGIRFDGLAGAIGGALFGLTLALRDFISNRTYKRKIAG